MADIARTSDGRDVTLARAEAADLARRLPGPAGKRFAVAFARGTMSVELYAPRGNDPQSPHDQDELYFVHAGSGEFVAEGRRERFTPGTCLFVPAGVAHRFENFSDDFAAWVVFWGPKGGEAAAAACEPR